MTNSPDDEDLHLPPQLQEKLRAFMSGLARFVEGEDSPYSFIKRIPSGPGTYVIQLPIAHLKEWKLDFPFRPIFGAIKFPTSTGWHEPNPNQDEFILVEIEKTEDSIYFAAVRTLEYRCLRDGSVFPYREEQWIIRLNGPNVFIKPFLDGSLLYALINNKGELNPFLLGNQSPKKAQTSQRAGKRKLKVSNGSTKYARRGSPRRRREMSSGRVTSKLREGRS
jgi:hypothetical protein